MIPRIFDLQVASENENNGVIFEMDKEADAEKGKNDVPSEIEKQARRKVEKREKGARDAEGFLFKPDGTRDGRSVRLNRF